MTPSERIIFKLAFLHALEQVFSTKGKNEMRANVTGKLLDVKQEQNGQYTNYRLVLARYYEDSYGQPQTDITKIDASSMTDEVATFRNKGNSLKNKEVSVDIVCDARITKSGSRAWLSVRVDPEGDICELKAPLKAAK